MNAKWGISGRDKNWTWVGQADGGGAKTKAGRRKDNNMSVCKGSYNNNNNDNMSGCKGSSLMISLGGEMRINWETMTMTMTMKYWIMAFLVMLVLVTMTIGIVAHGD